MLFKNALNGLIILSIPICNVKELLNLTSFLFYSRKEGCYMAKYIYISVGIFYCKAAYTETETTSDRMTENTG